MAKKRGNGEGSIYQRKDGRWVGQFFVPNPNGGKKRKYISASTEKAVRLRMRDQQHQISRNLPLDNERLRVGDWLDHWLREIVVDGIRPKTKQSYAAMISKHFKPALGAIRLAKLTAQDIERYKNAKAREGLAPKTIRNQLTVLRQVLKEAMSRELISRNVASLVKQPSVPQFKVRILTIPNAKKLLDATSSDRLAPLYALALGMGLRQSECLGLRWSDLNSANRTLTVTRSLQKVGAEFIVGETKTKRSSRTLYLPDKLIEKLMEWEVRQLEERIGIGAAWNGEPWEGLMFTTPSGGPLAGYNVTRRFQTLLRQSDLPRMRFHDLRHGAATILLALGVDMRTIMETLGHSQIHVTMNTYASVVPQLQTDAADRMGEALWG